MPDYPQIFVSWSSPDKAIAEPLFRRLKAVGLNVLEYSEEMKGGELLQQTVVQWIESSKIAVVLYSDQTAEREWIRREVDWCISALLRGSLKRIMPVHLGPQSDPPVMPAGLRALDPNVRQFREGELTPRTFLRGESNTYALANDLAALSGMDHSQILPAAIFAMTRQRADEVLASSQVEVDGLRFEDYWRKLCRALGMGRPPRLLARLKERYGDSAEELKPFEKGPTIAEIVDNRLRAVNEKRQEKNLPPLFLKWIHDDLRSPDETVADMAEDLWRQRQSLLIVDSLSTWAPEIREVIERRLSDFGRSSVLWLPPYTQQIGALDDALDDALRLVRRIRTEFRTLDDPTRAVTLDAMNEWAMSRWVHRVLLSFPTGLQPSGRAVNEMLQAGTPPFDPGAMWSRG